MNVLAFSASNSKKSINKQLVTYAVSLLENSKSEVVDINDYDMPIYNADLEEMHGIPKAAKRFKSKIAQADAIMISYAEHNGTYTAAYKSLLDWLSRIDRSVFQGKPMILLSTSPGPGGASSVLKQAIDSTTFFEGKVVASFSLPNYYEHFNQEEMRITDEGLNKQLKEAVREIDDLMR